MARTLILLAAVIPLIGQDCIGVRYDVTVEPGHDGCKRTVKARSHQEVRDEQGKTTRKLMPDRDELKRIAALYGQPAPQGDAVVGQFAYRAPSDVGGAAFYARFASPLGTVRGYVERIRGHDDLASQIDLIRKGADETLALLKGWFRSELGDSPQTDTLCAFIDGPFRRDVENVALYFWASKFWTDHAGDDNPPVQAAQKDLVARLAAYLLERDYIRPDDLPIIIRAGQTDKPAPAFRLIRRFVATKMGIPADKPIPKSLAFLTDPETARKSLEIYLTGTEQYRELLDKHRRENPQPDDDDEAPEPWEIIGESVYALAVPMWGFFQRPDAVKLSLATRAEPMHHNGTWDGEEGKVVWQTTVRGGDRARTQLPAVFWALWDEPNGAAQTKHFGKVVLHGEKLLEYCLWYNGLRPAEARQWDVLIGQLKPGDDLRAVAARLSRGNQVPEIHYDCPVVDLLAPSPEE